ncbi:MAG: hypothetical protein UY85_C0007G0009 [Candidatus Peribacteria bacterium GW2011_GWB1_54_5]|nr:MAG: hypothetical protein UY87_C0052G0010 [Candidatus Peribacteria bacterium GW2011_GWC2_54_8]KKW39367.1 MAG: hypothetical protein UY85_C0007G0009 [Candidatus Peribacteria bacterium GW2011_GWB1_54_5]KKW41362.1 MAG: hypothetical protein UY90_C0055G0003 [Candidatus Peregrinibacteria bacterium GW2011_GWA2_54_9]
MHQRQLSLGLSLLALSLIEGLLLTAEGRPRA